MRGFRGLFAACAVVAIALNLLIGAAAPASASEVGDKTRAERRIEHEIKVLRKHARTHSRELRRAVAVAERDSDARPGLATQAILRDARRA